MGVGVEHPDDGHPLRLGVAIGLQMLLGIDRVQLGRGGQVAGRVAGGHRPGGQVAPE